MWDEASFGLGPKLFSIQSRKGMSSISLFSSFFQKKAKPRQGWKLLGLGLGAAAHSDFGGCRFAFVRDLERYIQGVLEGEEILAESQRIPLRERGSEYLMLRLRTTNGIEEWEYRRQFYMNFDPIAVKLSDYEQRGWAERSGRRWHFTPEGFLLSNRLIGELLEAQEAATLSDTLEKIREGGLPGR